VFDPGEDEIVLDFLLEMDEGERKSLDGLDVDLILRRLAERDKGEEPERKKIPSPQISNTRSALSEKEERRANRNKREEPERKKIASPQISNKCPALSEKEERRARRIKRFGISKPTTMTNHYSLPHLKSKTQVDEALTSEKDRVLVIRFGHNRDPGCMRMDEVSWL